MKRLRWYLGSALSLLVFPALVVAAVLTVAAESMADAELHTLWAQGLYQRWERWCYRRHERRRRKHEVHL